MTCFGHVSAAPLQVDKHKQLILQNSTETVSLNDKLTMN